MNRLFAGNQQRSNGRLNITQLAIEADVKRWHLTHQHQDLKDTFQSEAAKDEARRATQARSADAFEELKKKHARLQKHCQFLEQRLKIYATAVNQLALENAALSDRDAEAAKLRVLPRQPHLP
ncbi:hypothetical protein [Streptomyces silvisoli]|uniref:G protein gamma domain-containing protein n=1 Tax=Streptomyces silvisoli TaxID=3034235 RepID=A0ABT5ZX79_9ACTN|nr:hypothetical protein [Streptomyces silvisoli]MDF3294439.1 hypothetical protein [Streptomyces silvisoli]